MLSRKLVTLTTKTHDTLVSVTTQLADFSDLFLIRRIIYEGSNVLHKGPGKYTIEFGLFLRRPIARKCRELQISTPWLFSKHHICSGDMSESHFRKPRKRHIKSKCTTRNALGPDVVVQSLLEEDVFKIRSVVCSDALYAVKCSIDPIYERLRRIEDLLEQVAHRVLQ
jgi:hypothetical protein